MPSSTDTGPRAWLEAARDTRHLMAFRARTVRRRGAAFLGLAVVVVLTAALRRGTLPGRPAVRRPGPGRAGARRPRDQPRRRLRRLPAPGGRRCHGQRRRPGAAVAERGGRPPDQPRHRAPRFAPARPGQPRLDGAGVDPPRRHRAGHAARAPRRRPAGRAGLGPRRDRPRTGRRLGRGGRTTHHPRRARRTHRRRRGRRRPRRAPPRGPARTARQGPPDHLARGHLADRALAVGPRGAPPAHGGRARARRATGRLGARAAAARGAAGAVGCARGAPRARAALGLRRPRPPAPPRPRVGVAIGRHAPRTDGPRDRARAWSRSSPDSSGGPCCCSPA